MNKIVPICRPSALANKPTDLVQFVMIDWLSVSVTYAVPIPTIESSIVVKYDPETGEIDFKTHCFQPHKGSYESTINIRSDGINLSISGNPSKYNKIDNVFGLTTLEQCISLYNLILRFYGVPELPLNTRITRIDVTSNYAVGRGNETEYLRMLSSTNFRGETGLIYPNGLTVEWFRGSKRHYLKAYAKAQELKRHIKKSILTHDEQYYMQHLIAQSEALGLIRIEYELKSRTLRDKKINTIETFNMNKVINLFDSKNPYKQSTKQVTKQSKEIYNDCINIGYSKSLAQKLQLYYDSWLQGRDMKQFLSTSTFYRVSSQLLQIGVDVRKPVDVSHLKYELKTLESYPLHPSDEYLHYHQNLMRLAN